MTETDVLPPPANGAGILPHQRSDDRSGERGFPPRRARFTEELETWSIQQNFGDVRLTVDDLVLKYLRHAAEHYQKNGTATSEVNCVRVARRHLDAMLPSLPE